MQRGRRLWHLLAVQSWTGSAAEEARGNVRLLLLLQGVTMPLNLPYVLALMYVLAFNLLCRLRAPTLSR